MKTRICSLDQRLYHLLMQDDFSTFTMVRVRDAYAESIQNFNFEISVLRKYLYSHVKRMIKNGWVQRDPVRRKRGQVYHVLEKPSDLRVKLISPGFEARLGAMTGATSVSLLDGPEDEPKQACTQMAVLEAQHKETRLDMLSSLGEAEKYKSLMEELPQLADTLKAEYLEARNRSSRLLGQLRALEKTLQALHGSCP